MQNEVVGIFNRFAGERVKDIKMKERTITSSDTVEGNHKTECFNSLAALNATCNDIFIEEPGPVS